MNIEFRNGLIFTSIQVSFRGISRIVNNVVIDTGAAETIISPDIVEDMGIIAELRDNVSSFYGVGGSIHNFFSKTIDQINIDEIQLKNVKIDFGVIDPNGEINGLLGLDLLMKIGAIIDLKDLVLKVDE